MTAGWKLGEYVLRDRSRRYRSQAAFAADIGIGRRTISKIEAGERINYAPRTRAAIEGALGWRPGSFERAMEGHAPVYVADEHLTELLDVWPDLNDQSRAMLVSYARDAIGRRRV